MRDGRRFIIGLPTSRRRTRFFFSVSLNTIHFGSFVSEMPFGGNEIEHRAAGFGTAAATMKTLRCDPFQKTFIVCLDLRNGTVIINAFCWLWINVFDCEMLFCCVDGSTMSTKFKIMNVCWRGGRTVCGTQPGEKVGQKHINTRREMCKQHAFVEK